MFFVKITLDFQKINYLNAKNTFLFHTQTQIVRILLKIINFRTSLSTRNFFTFFTPFNTTVTLVLRND